MLSEENMKIEIEGHADKGTGDDFLNDNILPLRAERIYNYLKRRIWIQKEKYMDERDSI